MTNNHQDEQAINEVNALLTAIEKAYYSIKILDDSAYYNDSNINKNKKNILVKFRESTNAYFIDQTIDSLNAIVVSIKKLYENKE